MVEEAQEIEKIKGEIRKANLGIKVKIFQLSIFLLYCFSLPIIAPMFGANHKDMVDLARLAVPLVIIFIPVGLYRIYQFFSEKKMLQAKLEELENNQEPEEKEM